MLSSDLGSSHYQGQPSIQNELKASMLHSQQNYSGGRPAAHSKQVQQQQHHQSLTSAMRQITDGLVQRNSHMIQTSAQPHHLAQSAHQSYLSDLFAKSSSQVQGEKRQGNPGYLNSQA